MVNVVIKSRAVGVVRVKKDALSTCRHVDFLVGDY